MRIRSLHTYPVKGAAGTAHESIGVGLKGLAGDRRWMIVDSGGRFVSQREIASLARLAVRSEPDGIALGIPGRAEMFVARPNGHDRLPVSIWRDDVDAAVVEGEADAALSDFLGQPVRLVHFDDRAFRHVSRDWIDREAPVAFADGYPILVTSTASLDELNARLAATGAEPVTMDRFRPNVVIEGAGPFAEDGWATIEIAGIVLDLVKPCARCVVTTIDQASGEKTGKEPLATLARFHRSGDPRAPGALFGWNAVPRGPGHLAVGQDVTVRAHRDPPWPIA